MPNTRPRLPPRARPSLSASRPQQSNGHADSGKGPSPLQQAVLPFAPPLGPTAVKDPKFGIPDDVIATRTLHAIQAGDWVARNDLQITILVLARRNEDQAGFIRWAQVRYAKYLAKQAAKRKASMKPEAEQGELLLRSRLPSQGERFKVKGGSSR